MKKIIKITLGSISLSCLALVGCTGDKKVSKDFYETGELKSTYTLEEGKYEGEFLTYYKDGGIKEKHRYKQGKLIDSSVFYYDNPKNKIEVIKYYFPSSDSVFAKKFHKNGKLESTGRLIKDSMSVGIWEYYNKNSDLAEIREYLIIKGEQYLNQKWFIDENQDTLFGGNHFRIDFANDTIKLGEPFQAVAYLYVPLFKNKNSEAIVVLNRQNDLFDKEFSNESKIKLDKFRNLNYDSVNRPIFPENNPSYTVVFGKYFKTPGEKTIRGYILEYYNPKDENDSIGRIEHKMYFDKKIFVKDTIE